MTKREFKSKLSTLVASIENADRVEIEHCKTMNEMAFDYMGTDRDVSRDLLTIWESSRCANKNMVVLTLNLLNGSL